MIVKLKSLFYNYHKYYHIIDFDKASIIISKIGIILIIFFIIIMGIRSFIRFLSCCSIKNNTNKVGNISEIPVAINNKSTNLPSILNIMTPIPPPPKIMFFGRSKSETIAINAFANVLYEKGMDWTDIKVGYRDDSIKNIKTGKNMEIDAYSPSSKIGIEYNGIQHYEYPNPFHNSREMFEEGIERDELKRKLCIDNGIKLIEIPYYIDTCIKCPKNNGKWKYKKFTNEEKWKFIKAFIEKNI